MNSTLLKSGIFITVFFIVSLIIKKYVFEEAIDNKSIITTAVSAIIVGVIFVFLNRKKQSSNDN